MAIESTEVPSSATVPVVEEETDQDETAARMSPVAEAARRRGGWVRRIMPREYLARGWRWKGGGGAGSRLASTLSRSLRWKRLPSSLGLRSGSAAAALDAVTFRVLYVVEAVVLGLALSCFFLCCGCHL